MRSIRKIALLVVAAAAVVAVAAPAANAAKLLDSKGNFVSAAGEPKLSLKSSSQWSFQTSWGLLSCSEMALPWRLQRNDGKTVKAIGGYGTASGCTMGGAKSFKLEPLLREITLNSPESGTADLRFEAEFPNFSQKCVYENTATPITYTAGTNVLKISKGEMKATPAACGPFLVSGSLNLTDPSGQFGQLFLY